MVSVNAGGSLLFIAESMEHACILEASAEKPGNVTKTKSFEGTSYSDFVAASKALRPVFYSAAQEGFHAAVGEKSLDMVGVGRHVLDGVKKMNESHSGGNTHLGILLLFTPLAVAAGLCVGLKKDFSLLGEKAVRVVESTTVQDALDVYAAINLAGAGGLGSRELSVRDPRSRDEIRSQNLTLFDVMRLSAGYDNIAAELAGGFPKSFEAANFIEKIALETGDLNTSIQQTFLVLLSKYPDSLIARKSGVDAAADVSHRALTVLEAGGFLTDAGRMDAVKFDSYLRSHGNKLNPGTAADVTAAGLFLSLLTAGAQKSGIFTRPPFSY